MAVRCNFFGVARAMIFILRTHVAKGVSRYYFLLFRVLLMFFVFFQNISSNVSLIFFSFVFVFIFVALFFLL